MTAESGTSSEVCETGTSIARPTRARTVKSCSAEAAVLKGPAEQIAEKIIHVHIAIAGVKMKLLVSVPIVPAVAVTIAAGAKTSGTALRESRMPELVVHFPFFLITEDIVSLRNFFKPFLRMPVIGIRIRVIFLCQLTIRLLNLGGAGILCNAKHFIIISFCCHFITFPYQLTEHAAAQRRLSGSSILRLPPQSPQHRLPSSQPSLSRPAPPDQRERLPLHF